MATPLHSSALLQVDSDYTSETFNAGFTFTAGNDATAQFSHYSPGGGIASVTIGGTAAVQRRTANADASTYIDIWDAFNIAGGTSDVVVVYAGSGGQPHYTSGAVQEWDAADELAYDAGTANGATGSGATPSVSTAASTSQASTVSIAACVGGALGDTNVNLTPPSGWTQLFVEQNAAAHVPGISAYHEETTAGTKTATFSVDSSAWAAVIASYTCASSATPPTVDTDPVSRAGNVGGTASFLCVASSHGGTGLYYQWQVNDGGGWANVGTDSNTYTTPTLTAGMDGYQYRVVVSDSAGSDTSLAATLTVIATWPELYPIAELAISDIPLPPAAAVTVKVRVGAAWVDGTVRRWNGSAWVNAAGVKRWNGSAWV